MQQYGSLNPQRGDIFLTRSPGFLGKAIRFWERIWTPTQVYFNHAGIMINNKMTFEALWTYRHENFFNSYVGHEVFLARPKCVSSATINRSLRMLRNLKYGRSYPVHKIIIHAFPPATKLFPKSPVCSEFAALYGYYMEALPYYNGMNPDSLHDILCNHYAWEPIFWGTVQ